LVFLNVKNKKINCNGHFAVRLPEDARQSDQKPIAKQCLCRAFLAQTHGKEGSLPCVFSPGARQRCFAPRRTAKGATRRLPPVPSVAFFLPCVVKKRTAKIIYRALSDVAHDKGALSCKMLPCALCRAPRQKTHAKEFAVRFKAFVVRSWRTAKPLFPVVKALEGRRCMLPYSSKHVVIAWRCPPNDQ
jgi:hypothetical protein